MRCNLTFRLFFFLNYSSGLGSKMGVMGLGSCVFTKKGLLDRTGIGDRGVRGSSIG